MKPFDAALARDFLDTAWSADVLPALQRYVAIPNKSPLFDAGWRERGHMAAAAALIADWCRARAVPGLRVEVLELPGRTPVVWLEAPGERDGDPVLLYGHLDKQPEMEGWRAGLGPWTPVLEGDRLYGRGGADDGYAAFAAVTALEALARQGAGRARCGILIEASEESGSPDLPAYVDALAGRIGRPSLVVCLDSGCGSYDRLWATTSLRGLVTGELDVAVLEEGVHSGDAGGVVPESFRVLRALLSRIEDEASGALRLAELHAEIPAERRAEAARLAEATGDALARRFPFVPGARPLAADPAELVLARTWRPALAVTGLDGAPAVRDAGNVLRPGTRAKLSLRLPPTTDAAEAARRVKEVLEASPPHGARVRFRVESAASGWNAPALAPWLGASLERASRAWFERPPLFMGEGGSIPFMAMLGQRFPAAQFVVTGVLGPGSNAHGPNEFLHLPTARRLAGCVAQILSDHAARPE
jgi:acetylornithine deacetylase/succinyl-diaminopimelate desuccinylase-like protein